VLCPQVELTGYSKNGTFAGYVRAQAAYLHAIPSGVEYYQAAPMMCAGVTAYTAVKQIWTAPGDWIAIVGIGGVGHLAIQFAKMIGLKVAAIDVRPDKLDRARKYGADLLINAKTDDADRKLKSEVGESLNVLVAAPTAAAFEEALKLTHRGGRCVLVGIPPDSVALNVFEVVAKNITVCGSLLGSGQHLAEVLNLAGESKIVTDVQFAPLTEINSILDQLGKGLVQGRAVLKL
jgi:propanol-preferring alcohol dehydrogenase